MTDRFCVIVPHYNHVAELEAYLPALRGCGLPLLVVDDGSDAAQRDALRRLLDPLPQVELVERPANGGKGAAMVTGIRAALQRGFTHGIGVDADGQHDPADVGRIRQIAGDHPDSIISGLPRFGADIPASRLYGRMITNALVRLETGSATLRDAMCGFRCYPLAVAATLLDSYRVRCRMDFDPEILVRAVWRGVPVRYLETRVRYPECGVSHFRLFRDNVHMTWMHIRLTAGALLRAPWWIVRGMAARLGGMAGRAGRGQR